MTEEELERFYELAPRVLEFVEHWCDCYDSKPYPAPTPPNLIDYKDAGWHESLDCVSLATAVAEVYQIDFNETGRVYSKQTLLRIIDVLGAAYVPGPYISATGSVEPPDDYKHDESSRSPRCLLAFLEASVMHNETEAWERDWHKRNKLQLEWAYLALKRVIYVSKQ